MLSSSEDSSSEDELIKRQLEEATDQRFLKSHFFETGKATGISICFNYKKNEN